jgi:hypothetical protein
MREKWESTNHEALRHSISAVDDFSSACLPPTIAVLAHTHTSYSCPTILQYRSATSLGLIALQSALSLLVHVSFSSLLILFFFGFFCSVRKVVFVVGHHHRQIRQWAPAGAFAAAADIRYRGAPGLAEGAFW